MNLGGDPERDDSGLPPVDIEIPDDARELDRDVQAYRREMRAELRRQRARRAAGPLAHDGMLLPLLSGCLILALIAGTLLTLFSADQTRVQPQQASRPATSRPTAPGPAATGQAGAGHVGGHVPTGVIAVDGKNLALAALRPAVLALVPDGCQCATAMRQLAGQATTTRVTIFFIGTGQTMRQLSRLATVAGPGVAARLAEDPQNVLGRAYRPAGLTAILVRLDGSVTRISRGLRPGLQLQLALRQLATASGTT